MDTDQELRLKCVEFVTRQDNYVSRSPILHMIHAQMLFNFINTGKLPVVSYPDANRFADDLLQKSLDLMIEEREQSDKSANPSNDNPKTLNFLESLIVPFARKLGFEKAVK